MKIALYTSIFGQYDFVKSIPEQTVKHTKFLFCDEFPDKMDMNWDVVKCSPKFDTARLSARYYKCQPHEVKHLQPFDISIYIDGSIQITSKTFIEELLTYCESGFGVHHHSSGRNDIYTEAVISMTMEKYKNQNLHNQVYKYFNDGFQWNDQKSLFETGILVRKHKDLKVIKLDNLWWKEILTHTIQDQISLPYACWKLNFTPDKIPGSIWNNNLNTCNWNCHKSIL